MLTSENFLSKNRPGTGLKYWLYRSDTEKEKLPLVIYIHGAGSRGDDLSILRNKALLSFLESHSQYECIAVAPQCFCDTWFELFDVLLEFIGSMRQDRQVDTSRVYLTGASMGGYTAWQVAMARPEWFASLVPLCGGGMYWNAQRLKNLPIWAFHGTQDKTVLPEESLHMVTAVNLAGGNARLTMLSDCTHNVWDPVYSDPATWDWMFSHRKKDE